jgi:hypothetical protein
MKIGAYSNFLRHAVIAPYWFVIFTHRIFPRIDSCPSGSVPDIGEASTYLAGPIFLSLGIPDEGHKYLQASTHYYDASPEELARHPVVSNPFMP